MVSLLLFCVLIVVGIVVFVVVFNERLTVYQFQRLTVTNDTIMHSQSPQSTIYCYLRIVYDTIIANTQKKKLKIKNAKIYNG